MQPAPAGEVAGLAVVKPSAVEARRCRSLGAAEAQRCRSPALSVPQDPYIRISSKVGHNTSWPTFELMHPEPRQPICTHNLRHHLAASL